MAGEGGFRADMGALGVLEQMGGGGNLFATWKQIG